jgi:hypothetical protein
VTQSPTRETTSMVPVRSPVTTALPAVVTAVERPATVWMPLAVGIFRTNDGDDGDCAVEVDDRAAAGTS